MCPNFLLPNNKYNFGEQQKFNHDIIDASFVFQKISNAAERDVLIKKETSLKAMDQMDSCWGNHDSFAIG